MSNIDIISMAVRNLFKRKLRTFLTILGVVVGTGAIVIMISLGIAMNESFEQQVQQMGDITIIEVYNPDYWNDSAGGGKNPLTKSSVEEFKKIKGVKAATPILTDSFRFVSGKYIGNLQVKGIDTSSMADFNYKLESGRLLDEQDNSKINMIFGSEVPYQFQKPNSNNSRTYYYSSGGSTQEEREPPEVDVMNAKIKMSYDYDFGDKSPINNSETTPKIKVKPYNINCVGTLKAGDWNTDYYVFMSLTQLEKIQDAKKKYEEKKYGTRNRNNKSKGYESASVKCESIDYVSSVQSEIKSLGYEAYSNMDSVNSMKEISNSLQALLGAIGAVSLFIAAIGITNTMIMAIYERTREIGIMKVIGAQLKDIKKLFLLEAALIGFLGGVFGIIISLIVSLILNNVNIPFLNMMSATEGSKISSIPLWLCLAALCFSTIIGLISGYFPAKRAMKLSALTAIKTE